MKKIITFLFLLFLVNKSNSQSPFDHFSMSYVPSTFSANSLISFYVLDSISDEGGGNYNYFFKLYEKNRLRLEQDKIENLPDSLAKKLNKTDISSWAKQSTKPVNDISEITNTENIFGNHKPLTNTEIIAILSPIIGKIYYNTTINQFVYYDGTAWKKLSFTEM